MAASVRSGGLMRSFSEWSKFSHVCNLKESSVSLCVALMASAHLHQIKRHYLVIPFRDQPDRNTI